MIPLPLTKLEPLFLAAYGPAWRKCLMADYSVARWTVSRWAHGLSNPPRSVIADARIQVIQRLAHYQRYADARQRRELSDLANALHVATSALSPKRKSNQKTVLSSK